MTILEKIIHYYPLNDNGTDVVGGISLEDYNGDSYTTGKISNCADFTGVLGYLSREFPFAFDYAQGLSCFAWIKCSGVVDGDDAYAVTANVFGIVISGTTGFLRFSMYDWNANQKDYDIQADFRDNAWHYVGLTFDNDLNVLKIYLDGTEATPVVVNDDILDLSDPPYNESLWVGYGLIGQIDEVLLAGGVLNSTEISYLYNSGAGVSIIDLGGSYYPRIFQGVALSLDACRAPQNIASYLSGFLNSFQSVANYLSDNEWSYQKLLNYLSGFINAPVNSLGALGTESDQSSLQPLGGEADQNQSGITSLGTESDQSSLQPLGGEADQSGVSSLGTEVLLNVLIGMGLEPASKLILQIGVFGQLFQNIRGQLARGDHVDAIHAVANGLIAETRKVQAAINSSSEALSRLQMMLSTLSRGDHISTQQSIIPRLVADIKNVQGVIDGLHAGVSVVKTLCLVLSRGDHVAADQAIINLLRTNISKLMSMKMELSGMLFAIQKSISTISGNHAIPIQAIFMELLRTNDIHAFQKNLADLADPTLATYSIPAEIYLDGRPLSSRVKSPITITYSEANVHNMITFSSADPELFDWCDPLLMPDSVRIEAQIGARMMQFIIIARPGESTDFTVTGISVSDFEDGLADDISYSLTTPTLASEIAAGLTNYCPVDWQVYDWVVPVDFSFSGKPLDGIQALAAEIGAIVRCADDGTLIVRNKRPVRPVDMEFAAPAVSYDESTVVELSHSEEESSGYNAVEVLQQADVRSPMLEIEETFDGHTPEPGETVRVRVYWGGMNPNVTDTYVTAGEMALLDGGRMYTQVEKDIFVEFKDGKGSVSYPISRLISHEWQGYPATEINYNTNDNELFIPDTGFAVAKIKYETQYQRYELTNHAVARHTVDMLIAVFFLKSPVSVYAGIRTEEDPKYGSAIIAPLLTDNAGAVARGTAYIDENKYPKSVLAITAPYNDLALDGSVAWLHDSRIGSPGNHHIKTANIIIDGPMVTNALELEKCLIF